VIGPAAATTQRLPAGGGDADAPPAAWSLLVVDDEEAVRFGVRTYFAARGFAVDTAASLGAAAACLTRRRYDAVVSDLRLTGSDATEGLELLRHVRAGSAFTPFVLLTGLGGDGVRAEAIRCGASAVLTKPRPLAELAAVVECLLARAAVD
jgi:DNA-binding response OmpR family regulator